MTSEEIKEKLKAGVKFRVLGEEFEVVEHIIWWQARVNENYDKYALLDSQGEKSSRLYIDGGIIGLAKLIQGDFKEPLPEEMEFEGRKYKKNTSGEFCIAKLVEGEEIYKEGDIEIWWDFQDLIDPSKGLSLGRDWESWEREDLRYRIVKPEEVEILN